MSKELVSSEAFLEKIKIKDYFESFKKQVVKDFNDENFSVNSEKISLENSDDFVNLIAEYLKKSHQNNSSYFSQLLYTIDVPEQLVHSFFETANVNWKELAFLISKREFLKVILKEKYSSL